MVGNDNEFQSEQSKYVNQAVTKPAESDVKTEGEPTKRKLSKKDYDILLEGAVKSDKKDYQIANILHSKGMSDSDIDVILAERKKKRTPEVSEQEFLAQASELDSSISERFPKDKINLIQYNSFNDYKNIKAPEAEISSPKELFDFLVDQDEEFQSEVKPYNEGAITMAEDGEMSDEELAKKLGVSEDYESWKATTKRNRSRAKNPMQSLIKPTPYKPSKKAIEAKKAIDKYRGRATKELDTDDPKARAEAIRAKYFEKYAREYNDIFKVNLTQALPEELREDEEFLKKVENTMHWGDLSIDLTGDGIINNRNILDAGIETFKAQVYSDAMALGQMVAGGLETVVMASEELAKGTDNLGERMTERLNNSNTDDVFAVSSGFKKFKDMFDYMAEKNSTMTDYNVNVSDILMGNDMVALNNPLVLVNESVSLLAKSAPYMIGAGKIQGGVKAAGLTIGGSKVMAQMTASTIGMGTVAGASYYSTVMDEDWFNELSPAQRVTLAAVNGSAEGLGESISAGIFNKMVSPALKAASGEVTKKSIGQFIKAGALSYGVSVSEEMAAEAGTAVVQTAIELGAKGKDISWERMKDPIMEAIDSAIIMTSGMKGATGAIRAPFEVQNLHIAKLGIGDTKLRSRAVIKQLSEEYENETDVKRKGIIGSQLSKALFKEAQRNKENAMFFEGIRKQSPQDYATLLEIADSFDKKVEQWNSMEEGAAKSQLGVEIKADFKTKLDIEKKYKDTTAPALGGLSKEVGTIVSKIQQGETLTLEEEQFYAENQAEVEDGFREGSIKLAELYTPLQVEATQEGVTELTEENTNETIDNIINGAETMSDDFFKGFKTTKDGVIRGLQSIKGAIKAIRGVNPDAKVFVHTNGDSFKKATGLKNLARGYYKSGNSIHFLAPAMNSTTGYHESTHGAFMEVLGNKSFDKLFGDISSTVKNSGEGAKVGAVISNFVQGYESGDMTEEGVVEFISMLADGQFEIEIEKGILRSIAESLASVLPFNVSIPSRTQGVQIMKDIAKSMQDGTPIDPDKVKNLKKRKDKGQESSNKAQQLEESTVENFTDGNSAVQASEDLISKEAGKAQVITAEAPTYSLKEALEKTDGRVIVITSDNTGIGEVDGKDVMGGIGYSFLKENMRDGVGFASVDQTSVGKVKNMVEKIGKGQDVTVLVMQQNPTAMLGNFYAADYLSEAILKSFPSNRKAAAKSMTDYLLSLAPISNPKKKVDNPSDPEGKKILVPDTEAAAENVKKVKEFAKGITSSSTKSDAIAKILDEMNFPLRNAIVSSILPKGYGKDTKAFGKDVIGIKAPKPNKNVNEVTRRLAENGFTQVDFWKKYSSPETNTEEYLTSALNGDWGYTYTGFVTNQSLDWGEEFQSKGVTHPQFNAKIPSKETFKLDGGYQVDNALKDELTFGYNQKKGMYTKPPAGLSRATSQSIFAGSFQESTQQAVLDLITSPDMEPFNEYHMLSSTPEGKAQIIGELGAMASGKLEQNLLIARDLEKQGRDKENIFFATGWYRGMDNLWRSEINYGFINRQFLKNIEDGAVDLSVPYRVKMKEAMDAKGLYELYPSLADYTLSIEPISGTTLGYHDSEAKTIAISRSAYFEKSPKGGYKMRKKQKTQSDYSKDFRGFMNTLYHEIQHAVQSIEGFTDGYNQNRIAYDARKSKKRTEKTSIDQLKDANALTRKLVEAKREKIDLYEFSKNLAKLAGQDVDEYGWSMTAIEGVDFKNVFGFINSTGDIKKAVEQYREGLKFFAPRAFGSDTTSAIYIAGMQGQNLSDSNLLSLKKLRSDAKKLYENNKKAFELAGAMQDFARKNMQGSYGLMYLNERAIEESLKEVSRVAYGATVNASRFGKVKSSLFGGFERSPSSFEVYQRNLGEAEARLVGRRGTTKQKNRMPLFSEMHPDVASTEIWIAPPASIITAIEENRVEIRKQEIIEQALDQKLMAQDERDDAEKAIQEKKDIAKKAMDILYEKMAEQMEVSLEKGKRKKGKAQLIEGTTSHSIQKKEVQEALIKAGIDGFVESGTGVNRLFEHLRFKFADKYRPLQNLQTAIEKAKGEVERSETNFRRAEALMHGKASEDARLFEENILKPLMDTMIKYNVSNEQLSEYLYALHAYERNEFVKNTIDPANEAGSGMTNEVAEEIKKKYESNKEQMDELSEMFYKITEGTRKTMLDFGLITKAQYDSFGMFEHYVPLVGTAVTPTSDLFDFEDSRSRIDSGKGGGIAVFGKEYKSVSGRYSEAQSPLESAVANYMRTISRARKNEVLQTLLNLTQENTDNRAWEVFTESNPDMRVRLTSNGQSIFIEEATGEEYEYSLRKKFAAVAMAGNPDYVPVKVEGRTSYIKFNDSRITRVLNNGGVGKTSAFVKGLSVASRYFTKVFTSYNPEFIVANLTRDVQTALFNQMAEQNMELSNISGESFVTETLGGIKNAVRAVYQFERGKRDKMDSEMRGYYEEYLSSGAKTDWFFLKTPAEIEADMVDYIQSVSPITNQSDLRGKAKAVGVKGKAKMKDIAKYVDDVNSSIENGVRFSAYVQARRNGVEADKAAEFSKELTINFNRSGEMGAIANSIFLFFNASVQGSTRLMRSLVKSKKARAVAGGLSAMSALITMMNMAVGGEDEDGIPYYEKIPAYEKERYLIIMYGSEEGNYAKIPLPYGLNIFFNFGTAVSEMAYGVTSPLDGASFMLNSVFQSFSPVSISKGNSFGKSVWKTITPTVIKPLTELTINEDYFGNRIYKEDFYFGADTPSSSRSDKNTAEWSKSMAEFLNSATGGNEFESGLIDWNPDAIEYMFTFMGGGTAKFMSRAGKAATKVAQGKTDEIEVNDVPFARLFMSSIRESEPAGRYYETRQELLKEKNKVKGALKAGKKMTPEMRKVDQMLSYEKKVQSEIRKLSKVEKAAMKIEDADKREQALNKIRDRKIKVYQWFNSNYYRLMKQK